MCVLASTAANDDSRQLGEEEESCFRQTRLIFVCVGPSIKNESWKMKSSALHAQLIVLIIFMLQHLDPLQRSVLLFVAEHNLPIGIIDNYTRVTGGGPIFNTNLRRSISRNELRSARRSYQRKLKRLSNPTAHNQTSDIESPDLDLLLAHIKRINSSQDIFMQQVKMAKQKEREQESDEGSGSSSSSEAPPPRQRRKAAPKKSKHSPTKPTHDTGTQSTSIFPTIKSGGLIDNILVDYIISPTLSSNCSLAYLGLLNFAMTVVQRGAVVGNDVHDIVLLFFQPPGPAGADADEQYLARPPILVNGQFVIYEIALGALNFANMIVKGTNQLNEDKVLDLGDDTATSRNIAAKSLQGCLTTGNVPKTMKLCVDLGTQVQVGNTDALQPQSFVDAHNSHQGQASNVPRILYPECVAHETVTISNILDGQVTDSGHGTVVAIPIKKQELEKIGNQLPKATPTKTATLNALLAERNGKTTSPSTLRFAGLRISTGEDDSTDDGKLFILLFLYLYEYAGSNVPFTSLVFVQAKRNPSTQSALLRTLPRKPRKPSQK